MYRLFEIGLRSGCEVALNGIEEEAPAPEA